MDDEFNTGQKPVDPKQAHIQQLNPVFHGTRADFENFRILSHFGDIEAANVRLGVREQKEGEPVRPLKARHAGANIRRVFLDIRNPARVEDDKGGLSTPTNYFEAVRDAGHITQEEFDAEVYQGVEPTQERFIEVMRSKGFDGLVYKNRTEGDADSHVIFDPSQVDEPRSTALATLAIPSEEDTSQEKPKQTGRAWRGIGSLMRRRLFPIAQVAQQVWGALPDEQKDQVTEFLNNPIDFGLGRGEYPPGFKGGLDYFRQMLGMGPEPPEGGIASLPMDEKSLLARAEQQGFGSEIYYHGTAADISEFDLNHPDRKDQGSLGTGVYMTDSPYLASSYSSMSPGDSRNVIPLRVRLKNPYYATLEEKQKMMLRMHNKSRVEAREIADAWTADLQERGHDGVILQYDPKDVGEANAVREIVVFDPKNIRSSFARFDPVQSKEAGLSNAEGGLVETSESIPELVYKAFAHGGFIDKPLYERTL